MGQASRVVCPYPVACHLLDAAAAIGVLWDLYVSPAGRRRIATSLQVDDQHARCLLMFWASLHDIGKIVPSFQAQAKDAFAALVGYDAVRGEGSATLRQPICGLVPLCGRSGIAEEAYGTRRLRSLSS